MILIYFVLLKNEVRQKEAVLKFKVSRSDASPFVQALRRDRKKEPFNRSYFFKEIQFADSKSWNSSKSRQFVVTIVLTPAL